MFLEYVLLSVICCFVGADDVIVYPTEKDDSSCKQCHANIPLELALKLNTITDENQLFREFISKEVVDDVEGTIVKTRRKPVGFSPDSVSVRFGLGEEERIERKAVSKPKPAGCIPELRSVSLQPVDSGIYYWPSCTRVEQCGGCCSHNLLSCQPVETELLNFQVIKAEYEGKQMIFKGKEIVSVEKHTKCKCDCITKEKDCSPLQEYRKGECRCVCKNKDAEAKCNAANLTMHWNPENCSCECLKVFDCSAGTYFSEFTCSCEPIPDETQLSERFGFGDGEVNLTFSPSRRRWPPAYSYDNEK